MAYKQVVKGIFLINDWWRTRSLWAVWPFSKGAWVGCMRKYYIPPWPLAFISVLVSLDELRPGYISQITQPLPFHPPLFLYHLYYSIRKQTRSLGKGPCCHGWWPQLIPWEPRGRRERTPTNCPLTSTCICYTFNPLESHSKRKSCWGVGIPQKEPMVCCKRAAITQAHQEFIVANMVSWEPMVGDTTVTDFTNVKMKL